MLRCGIERCFALLNCTFVLPSPTTTERIPTTTERIMSGVAVLLVAAGKGERAGGALPKQYASLLGKPILRWTLDTFASHPRVASIQVVIAPDQHEAYATCVEGLKLLPPISGGATRQESVRRGLEALATAAPDMVLIHD